MLPNPQTVIDLTSLPGPIMIIGAIAVLVASLFVWAFLPMLFLKYTKKFEGSLWHDWATFIVTICGIILLIYFLQFFGIPS